MWHMWPQRLCWPIRTPKWEKTFLSFFMVEGKLKETLKTWTTTSSLLVAMGLKRRKPLLRLRTSSVSSKHRPCNCNLNTTGQVSWWLNNRQQVAVVHWKLGHMRTRTIMCRLVTSYLRVPSWGKIGDICDGVCEGMNKPKSNRPEHTLSHHAAAVYVYVNCGLDENILGYATQCTPHSTIISVQSSRQCWVSRTSNSKTFSVSVWLY